MEKKRIIELDGLRGLAVLSVVASHYFGEPEHGLGLFRVGWIGVDAFFVLSGLLIGGILLDHRRSPNYFAAFYTRRAWRIFPIYYAVIAATLMLSVAFSGAPWTQRFLPTGAYLIYAQNVLTAIRGAPDGLMLEPTWTLAVEEQFYLLAPLFIYYCPRRRLLLALLVAIAIAPIARFLIVESDAPFRAAVVLLPCRWDALLCGVLAAYVQRDQRLRAMAMANSMLWPKIVIAGGALLVAAPWIQVIALGGGLGLFAVVSQFAVSALCAAYLLMIVNGAAEGRRFRSPGLRFFGRISYCLYLIHQPVAGFAHGVLLGAAPHLGDGASLAVTLLALGASIAIAALSWRFFEAPLIRIGHRAQYVTRITMTPSQASPLMAVGQPPPAPPPP